MADDVLDTLNIRITADTKNAESGIEHLVKTLNSIKGAANGQNGNLTKISNFLEKIGNAAKEIGKSDADNVSALATALEKLNNIKISPSLANQLTKIGTALKSIDGGGVDKLKELTASIEKINQSGGVGNIQIKTPKTSGKTVEQAFDVSSAEKATQEILGFQGAFERVANEINENALTVRVDASAAESATTALSDLVHQAEQFSGRPLLPEANTSSFQNMADAFQDTVESMGVFNTTAKVTDVEIKDIGDSASSSSSKTNRAFSSISQSFKTFGKNSAASFKQATKNAQSFFNSITRIAKYRLIRSALRAITDGFKTGIGNAYQFSKATGGELAKSLDSIATSSLYLKNTFATLAAPLINSFAPVLKQIIQLLAKFINMINYGVAVFTGKDTWLKAKETPVEYAAATDKATKANEKFKASILGIDEINPLADNSTSGAAGGVGGTNYSDMFEEVPTFDSNATQDVIDQIKNQVAKLTEYLSVALLAVGAILTFTGANIPLGVAMMAAGAVGLVKAIKLDWETTNNKVDTVVNAITAIVGGALLAVGGILAFSGTNVPLGIGLMAAGAVTLGTAIALHWGGISDNVKEVISDIALALGAAAFVVGAILTFSNPTTTPLGIGLMVAGASMMASAVAVNWNDIKEKMQGSLGAVTAVVSAATLAVGAVLAFTGANIPLGIGLMAAGAVGLGTVAATNWDSIKEKMQGSLGNIVLVVSAASLAVGAVLAFSGVATPLGIALMAAGLAGTVAVAAFNWDSLKESLQGSLGRIVTVVSGAALALGAILAFTGVATPLGIALMAAGAVGLATAVAANWDSFTTPLTKAFTTIKEKFDEKIDVIIKKWNEWKEDKKELIAELKAKISEKWEELKTAWNNFKEETKTKIAEYKAKLGEKWEELKTTWNNFKEETKTRWAEYKAKLGDKWTELQTTWNNFKEEMKERIAKYKAEISDKWDTLKATWDSLKEGTKTLKAELQAKLETTKENIDQMWSNIKNWWGEKMLSIKAIFDLVKSTVSGWWTNIKNWFNGGEGKEDRALQIGGNFKEDSKTNIKEKWWPTIQTWFGKKNSLEIGGKFKEDSKTNIKEKWWPTIQKWFGSKNLGVGAKLATTKSDVQSWVNTIQKTYNQTGARLEIGINGKLKKISVPSSLNAKDLALKGVAIEYTAAEGGFIPDGSVFLAREAGPELVGTMGGHTAVANNDQIVEGIESGVYAANQEQNALLRQQNALLQQLLAKDNGGSGQVAVSSIATGVDRYNRRAGKTVIGVATA